MLAVKNYPQEYIDRCRTQIDSLLAGYRAVAAALPASARHQRDDFERCLLAHLLVVLDAYFMHRTRAIEGKDGNPLNEVRMLAASVVQHGGVLTADSTIKYRPETAVLGITTGDPIVTDVDRFSELVAAYFAELQRRFT